ncbi:hypothetical protein F1542_04300 [Komagataeibacter sp. FXV3]|nr:hypothetical protein [Komagataeibacter sp. FXV3]
MVKLFFQKASTGRHLFEKRRHPKAFIYSDKLFLNSILGIQGMSSGFRRDQPHIIGIKPF